MSVLLHFIYLNLLYSLYVAPPVKQKQPDLDEAFPYEKFQYNEYLSQVAKALESDKEFGKRIQQASESNRTDHISQSVKFISHNIRTKLDEIKRKEIQRLNLLEDELERLRAQKDGESVGPTKLNAKEREDLENVYKMTVGKNHINHETLQFTEVDLKKLIDQVEHDMAKVDEFQNKEYKDHEIKKKLKEKKKLNVSDPVAKKKIQDEMDATLKRHREHEALNNPGSEKQLKEVWQNDDHLDPTEFNPNTFFALHDTDGNNHLDFQEIEALFQNELKKVYDAKNSDDDMKERDHERIRMRQKLLREMDDNKDNRISKEEFLKYSNSRQFHDNPEYKPEDELDKPPYNEEELEQYEKDHEGEEEDDYDDDEDHHDKPPPPPAHEPNPEDAVKHQL